MAEVVLFHHAHGLTAGVHAFADELRAAGHRVTTPDLYEGATFDDLDAGVANARAIGFGTVIERGVEAAGSAPEGSVYAGMSLGVLPAQALAQRRPGARGALLLHGAVDPAELGSPWPAAVAVQIHATDADPSFVGEGDIEFARTIVETADDGELLLQRGSAHLFTDSSLPAYDEAATAVALEAALAFLARVG